MKKATTAGASFVLIAAAFAVAVFSGVQENKISDIVDNPITKEEVLELIPISNSEELQIESVSEKSIKDDSDNVNISGWGSQGYWSGSAVKQVSQIRTGLKTK